MCGIAGIFNYADPNRPIDRSLLERMTRSIAHRGPDAEGFHVEGPIGLGHRRLSIVDLTPTGAQPMRDDSGQCWITYNGEFYNHADFRPALAARHSFRGTSDTETLLYLLRERGPAALAGAMGIFGFAYWDSKRQELVLARDHLGVKQVYFHDDGERVLFASEMKALLQCPEVPRELDPEALNQYLHFHTPLFERTFFRGIQVVRPGEYVTVDRRGLHRRTYWSLDSFAQADGDPETRVRALREHLTKVVSDQLMSDVPVGAFFSGGIDSSAVASFAKRAGRPPRCFGIHFSRQGVIDERPFQEAAAKALGLELELASLDGSSFPEDLRRAIYHQDEPVIGAAMLPMYHVSRLASRQVKVCLGGQAADEIFGGYARYALAHPARVLASWLRRKGSGARAAGAGELAQVGGNLRRQLADQKTLMRLAHAAKYAADWRLLYFETFAQVSEEAWRELIAEEGLVSRDVARETFLDTVARSPARDPGDKVMHWDLQTYLPGLFQQDDRMSMANSLESRVPLADPRLVAFAFDCGYDLKFRDGASKWILRQAVADVIPREVLTRRKAGFDTPAANWMKGAHADFVRDTVLSRRARQRGLWNPKGVERLLEDMGRQSWFDAAWKVLCVETWAQTFLDAAPPIAAVPDGAWAVREAPSLPSCKQSAQDVARANDGTVARLQQSATDVLQELRELGAHGTVFRVGWELRMRSGLMPQLEGSLPPTPPGLELHDLIATRRGDVAALMRDRIPAPRLARLRSVAQNAARGRILCFQRWTADFGDPIDWHLNPTTGRRWDPTRHWSQALKAEGLVGDVKHTWEPARFPQAFHFVRASAFFPDDAPELGAALARQILGFIEANPARRGIHWNSGQELAIRMGAWLFALAVLRDVEPLQVVRPRVVGHLHATARHIEDHRAYAEKAVNNNHIVAEALGGLLAALALPKAPEAARWKADALRILEEQVRAQFYEDGGYIQQSHNYHRTALQLYLVATHVLQAGGQPAPATWLAAIERSLDFLVAQQNPVDGRLPNFGANDGSMPVLLSTCDFSDFRPTMQTASLLTRGERLFEPGPWDENAAWFLGPKALDAPLRRTARRSVSFAGTGFHVLRGADPATYCAFRCGTLRDRFSQIDMLHADVWWRGQNVLVDAGSYQYNGADRWHSHFLATESHNTVMVDGRDQMLHFRRFKNLYRTRAALTAFEAAVGGGGRMAGEHYGYQRHPGGCVHHRTVLVAAADLFVVLDSIRGEGEHRARLHWLGGEYPFREVEGGFGLETPEGEFQVVVLDASGSPVPGDVVAGQGLPARGWLSRYYGEKVAVPSLVVERQGMLPFTLVSVLSVGRAEIQRDGVQWTVRAGKGELRFAV